jgi:hypothetical protein
MIEKLESRKFLGFIFIAVIFTILVMSNKVDASVFISWMTLNFGLYVGGNVVDNATNADKK